MFAFGDNFAGDEKGVEGAKIIHRTADFNNKTMGCKLLKLKKSSTENFISEINFNPELI